MNNIEILEEATAQVAQNLFKMKYPDVNVADAPKLLEGCIADTVFVINNFMRISADIAQNNLSEEE